MGGTSSTRKKKSRTQVAFLRAYRETGNITASAERAGCGRRTVYGWRDSDPDFAKEMDECANDYIERLEAEADRRGLIGVDKPVFYRGEQCGAIREYSDTLLIFRLKALRPDAYREKLAERTSQGDVRDVSFTLRIEGLDDK